MAQAEKVSHKELFFDILEDLEDEDFEKFKWFLEEDGIKKSELRKANRMETVDKITQTFGWRSAEVVKKLLEKIRRNDLVERLPSSSTGGPGRTLKDRDEGTRVNPLTESLKRRSERLNSASPSVYKVPLETEYMDISGCRRFSFGEESLKQNRTIMLLGATGSGKSTLINGMINYILGVNWEDDFRFKLNEDKGARSQAESQTSEVTVYKINHQDGFKVDYSLTIIDTPGFGDTSGIRKDLEITEQLGNLFCSAEGVSDIDAVCFVVLSGLARLSPTQRYVFDYVLSIFGRDITENIRILVTFSDGQHPIVLEAIKAADVLCPKTEDGLPVHFKFNNSAVFAGNKTSAADGSGKGSQGENFVELFWSMGTKNMKMFFDALNQVQTKSLTLTQEVLRERRELENLVERLQKITVREDKLEETKGTSEKVKDFKAETIRNKGSKIPALKRRYDGTGKTKLPVMASLMRLSAIHKPVQDEDKKTKSPVEASLVRLSAEHEAAQDEVMKLMERSAKCLERLKEIELKPNPLSSPGYIDMLIKGEKAEAKSGWKRRVQSLMDMREKAATKAKIGRRV